MKQKVALFLQLIILPFSLLIAQEEGEVVISEEHLQELAIKLYELKKARSSDNIDTFQISEDKLKNQLLEKENYSISSTETNEKKTEKNSTIETNENQVNLRSSSISSEENAKQLNSQEMKDFLQVIENFNENQTNQNQELLREFSVLRTEIEQLKQQQPEVRVLNGKSDEVVVRTQQRNIRTPQGVIVQRSTTVDTTQNKEVLSRLDSLQAELQQSDSLQIKASPRSKIDEEMIRLKNQVYLLHAKIDQLISINKDSLGSNSTARVTQLNQNKLTDTISIKEQIENERDRIYKELKEKYKGFKEVVYFDNNSTELKDNYASLVNELKELLKKEDQIDLMISGFASKTGAKEYNQQVSMKRAHELKKQLMHKGVSPNRILTDYKGIDNEASSLAEARRVEVKLIIRR